LSSIEATHLSKRFGNLTVLNNISLNVSKGEFFGLFGSNGAGKTTLLRILTGQLSADSGEVRTAGYSISDPISIKRSVGIVPEAESPPTFLTAREALELSCLLRNLNKVSERVDRWLDFFDLQEKSDVLCRDLSKGQRQKLMLISAFIHEPSILFLDEAFINLDPIYQRNLRGYLKSLVEEGRTIFMCTHILDIAEKLCSRVAVIDKGSIIAQGSIDELRSQEGENLEEIFIRTVKNENAHLP
jgi:ABC-2 type transport system ATP-binding protein